ncbi:MAG: hypothetical protein LBQ12_01530 [Deltaproteobacteria bacterium]|jgi:predicted ABC-type ATPase|nr:hypothetical protein [Deltaproteobacteria bacterium]
MRNRIHALIVAGPNGAGKSTIAGDFLPGLFGIQEYVNADTIANGVSSFRPETAAIEAGRIMLRRINALAEKKVSFGFESTLAARCYVPFINRWNSYGYYTHVLFFALPDVAAAISRVKARVKDGGHDVPESVIERRFAAGLKNFFQLYAPIVSSWFLFDNSGAASPKIIATGGKRRPLIIVNDALYEKLKKVFKDAP